MPPKTKRSRSTDPAKSGTGSPNGGGMTSGDVASPDAVPPEKVPRTEDGCRGSKEAGTKPPCGRSQLTLDHDPEFGKGARVKAMKLARQEATAKAAAAHAAAAWDDGDGNAGLVALAADTAAAAVDDFKAPSALWLVHAPDGIKWVCSDCGHVIGDHPEGGSGGGAAPRGRAAVSEGTRTSTASPTYRKTAKTQAEGKCEVTGSERACDACHIIPQNPDDNLKILQKTHSDATSLHDARNLLFMSTLLHKHFDDKNLSFEPLGEGKYRVHVHVEDVILKTLGLHEKEVKLKASAGLLRNHHDACIAFHRRGGASNDPDDENDGDATGGRGRGGGGRSGGGGGGRRKPDTKAANAAKKGAARRGGKGSGRGGSGRGGGGVKKEGLSLRLLALHNCITPPKPALVW